MFLSVRFLLDLDNQGKWATLTKDQQEEALKRYFAHSLFVEYVVVPRDLD